MEFRYRPGKLNIVPDALSRRPCNRPPSDVIKALTPYIAPQQVDFLPALAASLTPEVLWDSFCAAL